MGEETFFSIVIPSYNRSATIIETINSVISQEYTLFEIIIVDDGSTDHTKELILNSFENDKRIRVISQINKERGAARNNGLQNSKGEYVIFLDSDDRMKTNHLSTLNEWIRKIDKPDFIATKYNFTDEKNRQRNSDIHDLTQGFYDYKLFLNGNILACNICVRRENKNLKLFVEDRKYSIKEDWLFLLQNLFFQKIYIIDKTTISMLDHAARSMRGSNDELINKTLLAGEWIKKTIPLSMNELRVLYAHINYFCSIHSYLESRRMPATLFIFKSFKYGGIKLKYIKMFFKGLIGKRLIAKVS